MSISSYADLLREAGAQEQPQRLLFTFAQAGLPNDAGAGEQMRFTEKRGGTLTPLMCVDKLPLEWNSFDALLEESQRVDAQWDVVFVSSMSGSKGQAPASDDAEAPLKKMVEAIAIGQLGAFLAFNRDGELLQFH
ncbi:ribonucleotide reductase subunit alpha [Herminiimonas sp. NPDC097707]|uniref:ribonucleotide reductase subunit alpha n=1 Tax=Herminiimonas sp. NPDC097707 TaxID=3364007 RepID=UPI00383B9330